MTSRPHTFVLIGLLLGERYRLWLDGVVVDEGQVLPLNNRTSQAVVVGPRFVPGGFNGNIYFDNIRIW